MPCDDKFADLYETGVEVLEGRGLRRYEISNFSTDNAQSLHNIAYWSGKQYIGLGRRAEKGLIRSMLPLFREDRIN